MTDRITREQRSQVMKSIKAQSILENEVSKALWHKGVRFRKNVRSLFGNPDISIKKYKIVIFIDSCFWHACPIHGNTPKSNTDFWSDKLKRNKERDLEVNAYYKDKGWSVIRIWEHELKDDFDGVIEKLIQVIQEKELEI